jgi:hypothetical protein
MRPQTQRREGNDARPAQPDDDSVPPPKVEWKPTGRRRDFSAPTARALPFRWPSTGQHALTDLWCYVAAQVAENKDHFRALLALDKSIRRDTGTTPDGNEVLAALAGGMDVTNMSKAISFFARAGLLIVELGFANDGSGKRKKSRTIRLAAPYPFPDHVSIDLPYRRLNQNQLGARDQLESAKSTWSRVPDVGARDHVSDGDSPDRNQNRVASVDFPSNPFEAASGVGHRSATPEVAASTRSHLHDMTARRPSGRAFDRSPSIDADRESEV